MVVMPIILISLIVGLGAAAAAGIYYYRNPSTRKPESNGTPMFILGVVFIMLGLGFVVADNSVGYSWAPIGIVFVAVGARQRRQHRAWHS